MAVKANRIHAVHMRLTQFRIDELAKFIDHSRSGMSALWGDFAERFDKFTAGMDEDAISEYVDFIYDDLAQLRDTSPLMNRQAHAMMVYGTFESSLANLCRLVHRDRVQAKPPKRLYMKSIRKYLEPHIGKTPAPFGKDWKWMDEFRIIRNWIAHNGAKVERNTTPGSEWMTTRTFLRRNPKLIKISGHDDIIIEDSLIDRAIEKTKETLRRVHKATKKLYR